ncbi:tyrosine-protein phosphatase [Oxalobacter vibrioformis]|uniref:Tyrosine-protein phosphatase n=1 Tax=Oxalobacter vibrioformis TaxID=933080 RepID=A0A9E9M005_9BURK|nr:tyrosine-protein phosphatase [Oxalobacter vibrioformis]WAW10338.1 tyrosine-protein phosphatase [Oxalobacter vibrioformis]
MSNTKYLLSCLLALLALCLTPHGYTKSPAPGERIVLETTWNTRDLGGYNAANGKKVIHGKLFRTDEPSSLSEKDMRTLSAIPLVTLIDFRSIKEQQDKPDRLPENIRRYYFLPITPGKLSDVDDAKIDENLMIRIYRELVTDKEAIAQYTEFFRILQADDSAPLAFHCAAGKDRTGVGAALVLYSLGVDDTTIMKDYLQSASYIHEKYADILKQKPAYAPLLAVKREYLQAAIDTIRNHYGSMDNYLQKVLQVNISRMQEKYLQ